MAQGHRRQRTTRTRVRVAEVCVGTLIRLGGLGTVVAVVTIFGFLAWVVVPLFLPAQLLGEPRVQAREAAPGAEAVAAPCFAGEDEQRLWQWSFDGDGVFRARLGRTGECVVERRLAEPGTLVCWSYQPDGQSFALGLNDGHALLGRVQFATEFVAPGARPELWQALGEAEVARAGEALVCRTPTGDLRVVTLALELAAPQLVAAGDPLERIDRARSDTHDSFVALTRSGRLALLQVESSENLITGAVEWQARESWLPFAPPAGLAPRWVAVNQGGSAVYVVWSDGRTWRYDTRRPEAAVLAQTVDLTPEGGELTALCLLIGRSTLVVADDRGAVDAWFPVKPQRAGSSDGIDLIRGHRLVEETGARGGRRIVRRLASSSRGRVIAAADDLGGVRVWNVTSEVLALDLDAGLDEPIEALTIPPKEDGVLALSARSASAARFDLRHPEATLATLFRPVWYEDYETPSQVWQSSSGTDAVEPKLGLWPLVFGTLKATFYSMIFAVPLALLAALYTSQFLHPRLAGPLKSAVEMMASLPSVVLGFLAGIVIAPFVESLVPAVLAALFCVPCVLLVAARVAQHLGAQRQAALDEGWRLPAALGCVLLGLALAWLAGPLVESVFFAGDLRAWLSGNTGTALGGWFVLFLPASGLAVAWYHATRLGPRLRVWSEGRSRQRVASAGSASFGLGLLAAAGLALALAGLLDALGFDTRGGLFDTYVQRNSMIVGAMMGFAVIPILFTITEDALSAVPAHLKLASIGAGATPWQTAVRVVLPTAASGIFSAIMVGLGRAVGETMIVLMAVGNTPVTSWNVFDGFRTLSANVATELPEAVPDSTHYRTLFLAALCLFLMTFVLNTLAELVRQRYRKRAVAL